jgi:tetratricopeptide (TPR) repeat protein
VIRLATWLVPALAAIALFAPSVGHEFLQWDDPAYVTGNPLIERLDPGGFADMLDPRTRTLSAWTPTTLLTYAIETRLFGRDPAVMHATNVMLHALNAVLVALLLARIGLGAVGAAVGGILFAVHPLQVEAVAWVSGRKDLLATALSLGAILLYLRRTGGTRALATLLFVFALGAKSSSVVVPVLLLALHWALRSRPSRAEAWSLAGMTVLGMLRGTLEIGTQAAATAGAGALGFLPRMGAMVAVLGRYVRRWLLPHDLAIAYPVALPDAWVLLTAALLLLAAGVAIRLCRDRPPLVAGLLWWPLALLPVLNLVPAPYLEADRYQYLALLGPALWVGYGTERALRHRMVTQLAAGGLVLLAVVALGARSRALLSGWASNEAFFATQLERSPEWWMGRLSFALWHLEQDRLDRAEAQVERVRSALPGFGRTYHLRGLIEAKRGNLEQAFALQAEATRLDPTLTSAWANQCVILGAQRRFEQAVPQCETALALDRHQPRVRRALALVLVGLGNESDQAGQPEAALRFYGRALTLEPGLPEAHLERGVALQRAERHEEAIRDYFAAARGPGGATPLTHAGDLLRRLDRRPEAISAYREALARDPAHVEARYGLAIALAAIGDLGGARDELERVLEIRPDLPEARRALARIDEVLAARGSTP